MIEETKVSKSIHVMFLKSTSERNLFKLFLEQESRQMIDKQEAIQKFNGMKINEGKKLEKEIKRKQIYKKACILLT